MEKSDGTQIDDSGITITYDNEIVDKFAQEGSLTIQNINTTPIFITGTDTPVTELNGYNKIYTFKMEQSNQWFSKTDEWTTDDGNEGGQQCYLSKTVDNKLYLTYGRYDEAKNKIYIELSEVLDDDYFYVEIYTKKVVTP